MSNWRTTAMPFRRWSFTLVLQHVFSFCNRSGTLRKLSRSIRHSPRYSNSYNHSMVDVYSDRTLLRQTIVVLLPIWLSASSRKHWRILKWYVWQHVWHWIAKVTLIRCHRYRSVHQVIRMQRWSWMNVQRSWSVLNLKRLLKYVIIHCWVSPSCIDQILLAWWS